MADEGSDQEFGGGGATSFAQEGEIFTADTTLMRQYASECEAQAANIRSVIATVNDAYLAPEVWQGLLDALMSMNMTEDDFGMFYENVRTATQERLSKIADRLDLTSSKLVVTATEIEYGDYDNANAITSATD